MKIVEAVRLGMFCGAITAMERKIFRGLFGVAARSVAGLAFALWLTIGVAVPASASEDWKEEIISEIKDVVAAVSKKLKISEIPGAEFSMAKSMYDAMTGFCVGFAHNTQVPTPESIVELSAAIHRDLMRGKVPSDKTIVRLGELCLNRTEEVLVESGLSQRDAEGALAPAAKDVLLEIRKNLGL